MSARTQRGLVAVALGAAVIALAPGARGAEAQRHFPQATAAESGFGRFVEASVGRLEMLEIRNRRMVAESFHRLAVRYHARIERWSDAAVFHLLAAELRGLDDSASVEDLRLAASFFHYAREPAKACAAMEKAAMVALRVGRYVEADRSLRVARQLGGQGCSEKWEEMWADLSIPAPAPIEVPPPALKAVDLEEGFQRPVLRIPEISAPPVGRQIVFVPRPPGMIRVAEPVLWAVELREPRWHPPASPPTDGR